jgi:internalin A
MNLYRNTAKTSMKLPLCLSAASVAIPLLSFQVLQAATVLANNQSFEQWCLQKDSLSVETKKTIEVLLKKSGTKDCRLADAKLDSLSELYLPSGQITDVKPIASLNKLTHLHLGNNQIRDIKPLESGAAILCFGRTSLAQSNQHLFVSTKYSVAPPIYW